MNVKTKILSILLSVLLVVSLCPVAAFSASTENGSSYPYVLVHGMLGWGYDDERNDSKPYWGYTTDTDLVSELNSKGYEVYSASVGGISSAWDRACELYAQLTGTTVDYGVVHSANNDHARYGRSYAGNALMENFGGVDENGEQVKVNLIGHSFGGATIRLFTYILENGCPEEMAAAGESASDFFKGGKGSYVHSITTLSSPNNGAITADFLYDTMLTATVLAFMANVAGSIKSNDYWDFRLEQWGLTAVPEQGISAGLNLAQVFKFALSEDNCGYDISVDGAEKLNSEIGMVDSVYYFCYSGSYTTKTALGTYVPKIGIFPLFYLSSLQVGCCAGRDYGQSYELTSEWQENDGIVSVKSAQNPLTEPGAAYPEDGALTTGVWYIMPVLQNMSHVGYMGMGNKNYRDVFYSQIDVLART